MRFILSCAMLACTVESVYAETNRRTGAIDHIDRSTVLVTHLRRSKQKPEAASRLELHLPAPVEASTASGHQGPWGIFNRFGGTAAGFGPVATYGAIRWTEDWSKLRDPQVLRTDNDFFDALKYIPLNHVGSIWLSLSGEERLKNWFENRPGLGSIKPNDSGRMTLQSVYGADLHLGEHVRMYGEVLNAAAGGWNGYGYNAGYRSRLDLQQGFLEFDGKLAAARSGLMVGRMEFVENLDYALYLRTVSSVPQSWNGLRGFMVWPRVRVDLFDFVQTDITPRPIFHDRPDWGTRLFGGYESTALPDFHFLGAPGHIFADLFYLGYLFHGASAVIDGPGTSRIPASSRRDNYGIRLWGAAGPVEFSLGGICQYGHIYSEVGSRPVRAYAINTTVGWRFKNIRGAPLAGLQTDVYSGGDRNRTDGPEGTYATPFVPLSGYLDESYYTGYSNLGSVAPFIKGAPAPGFSLSFKVPVLWRENTEDAFYAPSVPYSFTMNGRFIGVVPQMSLSIALGRHIQWKQDLARFFVSRNLARGGASDSTYYLSTISFTF